MRHAPRKSLVDNSASKACPYRLEPEAPVPGGVTDHCEPSGRGGRDMGRRAAAAVRSGGPSEVRPAPPVGSDRLDRKPPHSDAVRTGVKGDKRAGYMGDTFLPRRSMLLIR